ncbi:hypothetical protein BBOV_I003120 [Babesia bovis T2Bo]|uniref:Uncharacterized protein n=1 Tax=Babesia bovis TaxID=5865 RepID=A7AWG6_BABBO|nr:hypothetical protein BBOV_I003120 [Babesia bovis T2Bo]EDO05394.1 hypothetical protein BBOV_I003120 [Babesia bovis T2Bo]|eukprot:XP_001608962.1 hypothetical protein [Babesia bovis T2Bo]
MKAKKLKQRSPSLNVESSAAEHTGANDKMIQMVAVYREDGGIKAFVPVDSRESKMEEPMESSSDELCSMMGRSASNAGSTGWISQTIAKFNKESARDSSKQRQQSNLSPKSHGKNALGVDGKTETNNTDIFKDLQSDDEFREGKTADRHIQNDISGSQTGSIPVTPRSEKTAMEDMEADEQLSMCSKSVIEDMMNNTVAAKLSECMEKCEDEIRAARSEQEHLLRQVTDDVMKKVDDRIKDMCSKLEQSFAGFVKQNNADLNVEDHIKDAIEEAKTEMQETIQQDVEAKIERMVSNINETIQPQASAIEKKLEDALMVVSVNESIVNSMPETILQKLESKVHELIGDHETEAVEFQESVKLEIDECKSKGVEYDQRLDELVRRLDTLQSNLEAIASKLDECSTKLMTELETKMDTKLVNVVSKDDLGSVLDNAKAVSAEAETKAIATAAQECDEKLGVWAMDMEDKMSQDFYRIVEERVQELGATLLKQLANTIEQKFREFGDTVNDDECQKDQSSESAIISPMSTDAYSFVKSLRKTIQVEIEHVLSPITKSFDSDAITVPETESSTVGTDTSGGLDSLIKRFNHVVQKCREEMKGAVEVTRRLEELNKIAAGAMADIKEYTQRTSSSKESVLNTDNMKECKEALTGNVSAPKEVSKILIDGVRSISEDVFCNVHSSPKLIQAPNYIGTMAVDSNDPPKHNMGHDCAGKGNKPTVISEYTVPMLRPSGSTTRCTTLPMDMLRNADSIKHAHFDYENTFREPSSPVEVKYVNVNGQIMKVTQEHFKLSQIGQRPVMHNPQCGYHIANHRNPPTHFQ